MEGRAGRERTHHEVTTMYVTLLLASVSLMGDAVTLAVGPAYPPRHDAGVRQASAGTRETVRERGTRALARERRYASAGTRAPVRERRHVGVPWRGAWRRAPRCERQSA